jgi:hypothetical protein
MEELISQQQEGSKQWKCLLCQKFGDEGDLHLGCFNCPAFTKITGNKTNF